MILSLALSLISTVPLSDEALDRCAEHLIAIADKPSGSALAPEHKILASAFSFRVFRVSDSAQDLLQRFERRAKTKKRVYSEYDQYLDLTNYLREHHVLLEKYVAWLKDIQEQNREATMDGRELSDEALSLIADGRRAQFFELKGFRLFDRGVSIDEASGPTVSPEEFKKQFEVVKGMASRSQVRTKRMVERDRAGEPNLIENVIEALGARRRAVRALMYLAKDAYPEIKNIQIVQQLARLELTTEFPDDFDWPKVSDFVLDSKLQEERLMMPYVKLAFETLMSMKRPPKNISTFDEFITRLTIEGK